MKEEHNGILNIAVPKMSRIAKQNDLVLHVVDLRWGVLEDGSGLEPDSYEIAEHEIKRCCEISVGPFFVVSIYISFFG